MATEDRQVSPFTGYTRAHWAQAADQMLLALRPFTSDDHARVDLPGQASAYGRESDSLEAFARTFLLAAIRLRGESGGDPHGLAQWYAAGLRAGTDPTSPNAWPRPDRLAQAKVEACSIALGLHLSRPWLWDLLDSGTQQRTVEWLGTVVGESYPPINWVWFQIVVETFLRSVGGPWSPDDIAGGLAVHESLYRGEGWYSDGAERAFDHYGGWAMHVYPLLWAEMAGELCPDDLRVAWRGRLAEFLGDAVALVGADGSPLLQGRSLIYRFAAAAPFWVGAITGAGDLSAGTIRRACSGMLRHFASRGVPDERGLLTLGWHHEWPAMAQSYSGPGSPYWSVKGMLGLALPADHPVWTAVEEPLPVERADRVAALSKPGWLVSATSGDGLVRVVNHGTDHSVPGDLRADSPLYARLGYSTATSPPLIGSAVGSPPDNSIVIVDATGRATHRNGFESLGVLVVDGQGHAVSRAHAHWVATEQDSGPDHGSGRGGAVRHGPVLTIGSIVRGAVEVRAVRVDSSTGLDEGTLLEFSGWPVAGDEPPAGHTADDPVASTVTGGGLTSSLTGLAGLTTALVHREQGTSPLAEQVAVPALRTAGAPQVHEVYVAAVVLHGSGGQGSAALPTVTVTARTVSVRWPDGAASTLDLPDPQAASGARQPD